jgi:hypothetical protein
MHTRLRAARLAVLAALAVLGSTLPSACSKARAAEPPLPVVVVATPRAAAAPEVYEGAEAFTSSYAAAHAEGKAGGKATPRPVGEARHLRFPESAKGEAERDFAKFIVEAASDPRVGAIVVDPAPRGSAAGFARAKAARAAATPKAALFCVAVDPVEEGLALESAADLVIGLDRSNRAYVAAWAAKKLGAVAIVAAYGREDSVGADAARERAIMSAAAADLGLRYAAMIAPEGVDAAAFVRAGTGSWLRDFGPAAALYCSSPALAAPLMAGAIAGGGILADAAGEATTASCASALGLDLSAAEGDAKKERKLLEDEVSRLGLRGKLCLWDSGYAASSVEGLGEYAMRVATGKAKADELRDLCGALDSRARGAAWIASYDLDPATGVKSGNSVLLRQDVYAIGYGYLQSALQATPRNYLLLGGRAGD